MTPDARKDLVRRWIAEIWEGGNTQVVKEMGTASYVYRASGQGEFRDESFVEFVNAIRTAVPDLTNFYEQQLADGDTVVTRGTTRGTHQGPFGDIAASGNTVEVPWVMITKLENGQISEEWEIFDTLALMTQLGAVSVPG